MPSLVWFRRDLRIQDNRALQAAAKAKEGVVGLYVVTPKQWQQHDECSGKVAFWLDNLRELSEKLSSKNIPLLIRQCDDFEGVPEVLADVVKQTDCDQVFFNREYEVNEVNRDEAVVSRMEEQGISCTRFHDRVLVPPRAIETKQAGKFYSVYTPYRKVWDTLVDDYSLPASDPAKQPSTEIESSTVPESVNGFEVRPDWLDNYPAGEEEANRRLKSFAKRIADYHDQRDLPSVEGTSELSPYLAAGVISPRQCLAAAREFEQANSASDSEGVKVWVSELTWRDFYTHVLVGFPRVSKHQPFKRKTEQLDWRSSEEELQAWKDGRTGYPIVDAGMRQLKKTGWMHNRLRMVTAMFLTKNLLIDWRLGEKHFMECLIDGDLAANNGGWQWSASTGTDSVPYFRIFNPFSQSKRFDAKGEFIKAMCPELEPIPASALHDPKKLAAEIQAQDVDYPEMIVDYKFGRERALDAFKNLD